MKNQNLEAFSEPRAALVVKWKQSGKADFFQKNLRIQFHVVFHSESNSGIFDHLVRFDGELCDITYVDLKICAAPTAYAKWFLRIFFSE